MSVEATAQREYLYPCVVEEEAVLLAAQVAAAGAETSVVARQVVVVEAALTGRAPRRALLEQPRWAEQVDRVLRGQVAAAEAPAVSRHRTARQGLAVVAVVVRRSLETQTVGMELAPQNTTRHTALAVVAVVVQATQRLATVAQAGRMVVVAVVVPTAPLRQGQAALVGKG